jgi:fatty-acyl-CoA synthase
VITFPAFKPRLEELLAGTDCRVVSTDDVPSTPIGDIQFFTPDHDTVAFLQHSSGTTGLQKGVALSHRAVLNQIESYSRTIDLRDDDVVVSWLPLYHDMGLIAGFVMPIVAGIPLVMMSPFQWVRSPKTLLQAIHEYRGTLCWLPNFAYNHCALTIRQRDLEGLDLSSWRAAINCSEPVRLHSHQTFLDKFGPYGFKESALATSYAMAEMVFAVTQSEIGRPPRVEWIEIEAYQKDQIAVLAEPDAPGAMSVVSCGRPIDGVEVAVIDANGGRLPERQHGQIITRGNAMLTGYYKRPDLTEEALLDSWYKTGDMGYIADGEVYISGRAKDLIIVAGKNVYPQDLEAIANTVPGVYPGRAVAFGVEDAHLGTEAIVMVAEVDGEGGADHPDGFKALAAEVRKRVVQQTEVTLNDVRLVEERWVIKTSSGKIARADNRAKYLKEFRGGNSEP